LVLRKRRATWASPCAKSSTALCTTADASLSSPARVASSSFLLMFSEGSFGRSYHAYQSDEEKPALDGDKLHPLRRLAMPVRLAARLGKAAYRRILIAHFRSVRRPGDAPLMQVRGRFGCRALRHQSLALNTGWSCASLRRRRTSSSGADPAERFITFPFVGSVNNANQVIANATDNGPLEWPT
jgi:hypothetical protein